MYEIGQFSDVFHMFFNDFWCFPWGDFLKFFQDGTFVWGSILMSPGIFGNREKGPGQKGPGKTIFSAKIFGKHRQTAKHM